jgi:hypothetical protein
MSEMNYLNTYKLKCDIKETSFSPYKIPFNYEMLAERQRLDPGNKNAYRQYLLPDQKTMISINVGDTDIEFTNELVEMYGNSSTVNWNLKDNYHAGNETILDYKSVG